MLIIKENDKETKKVLYKIVNNKTQEIVYIGKTNNYKRRSWQHKRYSNDVSLLLKEQKFLYNYLRLNDCTMSAMFSGKGYCKVETVLISVLKPILNKQSIVGIECPYVFRRKFYITSYAKEFNINYKEVFELGIDKVYDYYKVREKWTEKEIELDKLHNKGGK